MPNLWHDLSLSNLREQLAAKALSAVEATKASLARIEKTKHLNTFITVDGEGALAQAEASDQRRKHGRLLSPLDGVPVALKDLLITEGLRTTAASRILQDYVPPYDGTMSRRLKAAGVVLLGKTNLDEFAMGSSNEHSGMGPVRNPWDHTRIPGGSSGGSAAAVAAGQVFGALGTDTGGSIRQPAALCGVYGLKPTYGRVSRFGVIAFASSLDQVGPFGRSTEDIAHLLQAIAGFDERDSTSVDEPVPDYTAALSQSVSGLRLGVPEEYFGPGLDPDVKALVQAGIQVLEEAGAKTVPIHLPHTKYALSTYYILCTAEASSNLARYDGVRYGQRQEEKDLRKMYAKSRFMGFGEEVQRRIMLGTYVLSAGYYDAYYHRAQCVRTLIRKDFEDAFQSVDLIVAPTSPVAAFKLNERLQDPLSMYLADIYTLAVNLAGIPGLSVPVGLTPVGLPVGLQLMGSWFDEPKLLTAAQILESNTDHASLRPEIESP